MISIHWLLLAEVFPVSLLPSTTSERFPLKVDGQPKLSFSKKNIELVVGAEA